MKVTGTGRVMLSGLYAMQASVTPRTVITARGRRVQSPEAWDEGYPAGSRPSSEAPLGEASHLLCSDPFGMGAHVRAG